MLKKLFCFSAIIITILCTSGCGKYYFEEDETTESLENIETEQVIQYELNYVDDYSCQSEFYDFKGISRSSKGYYFLMPSYDGRFIEDYMLYFYDIEKNFTIPLCSRTDCDHMDINKCSARFGEDMYQRFLMFYGDKLYFIRLAEDGGYLVSRDEDGSNLRQIEKMWDSNAFYVNTSTENYGGTPRINNGYIYYTVTEDNTKVFVYRLKLDGSAPKEMIYEFEKDVNCLSGITIRCDNNDIYISHLDSANNYNGKIVLFNENNKSITDIYYNDENGRSEWADDAITTMKTINGLLIYRTQTGVFSYNYKTGENKKIIDVNSLSGVDENYVYSSLSGSNRRIIITEFDGNRSIEISYSDFTNIEPLHLSGVDERFLVFTSGFEKYLLNKNAIGKDNISLIKISPNREY